MQVFAVAVSVILAAAIIVVGIGYIAYPRAATQSFGLPLPEAGPNVAWWLRLKGLRDVVAGLAVLAMLFAVGPWAAGLLLLVYGLIPLGDMLTIIAARGSLRHALGIHGVTAVVMGVAAVPLLSGLR